MEQSTEKKQASPMREKGKPTADGGIWGRRGAGAADDMELGRPAVRRVTVGRLFGEERRNTKRKREEIEDIE
jgi:hypothetical protein